VHRLSSCLFSQIGEVLGMARKKKAGLVQRLLGDRVGHDGASAPGKRVGDGPVDRLDNAGRVVGDGFARSMKDEFGVETGVYYSPAHKLQSLKGFTTSNDLTETEIASNQVLSLPIYPGLSRRDLDQIARGANRLLRAGG
jgi:hypothetical protein